MISFVFLVEESQLTGEMERDLLVCYDPSAIKNLVQKLSTRITSSQLVYLSQKVNLSVLFNLFQY